MSATAPATDEQAARPAWILLSVARRGAQLGPGSSCELRVGRDVFALTAVDGELSVTAGLAPSADAVITMEPDVFYALATERTTPGEASERVDVAGDSTVAARVLEALSGAAVGK